jgi:hypothetical protein
MFLKENMWALQEADLDLLRDLIGHSCTRHEAQSTTCSVFFAHFWHESAPEAFLEID